MKLFLNFSGDKLKLKKIIRSTKPIESVQKSTLPIPVHITPVHIIYTQGYTKALLDILHYFEDHSKILIKKRVMHREKTIKLIKALITYRDELRETGDVELMELTLSDGSTEFKHYKEANNDTGRSQESS